MPRSQQVCLQGVASIQDFHGHRVEFSELESSAVGDGDRKGGYIETWPELQRGGVVDRGDDLERIDDVDCTFPATVVTS